MQPQMALFTNGICMSRHNEQYMRSSSTLQPLESNSPPKYFQHCALEVGNGMPCGLGGQISHKSHSTPDNSDVSRILADFLRWLMNFENLVHAFAAAAFFSANFRRRRKMEITRNQIFGDS